jgi:hypothetical protein
LPAFAAALVCAFAVLWPTTVSAQPKNKGNDKGDKAPAAAPTDPKADAKPVDAKGGEKSDGKTKKTAAPKTYDFTALDLNGRMRSPQLL